MRRFSCIIIYIAAILMLADPCEAQTRPEKDIRLQDHKSIYLTLDPPEKKFAPSLLFRSIEVVDVRYDTVVIGLSGDAPGGREKKFQFRHGAQNDVKQYYQASLTPDTVTPDADAFHLVGFIKKLYLSEHIYLDGNKVVAADAPMYEIKKGVMATIDFFARKGELYIPLYRFDSVMSGDKPIFWEGKHYISRILTASLRRMETLDAARIRTYARPRSRSEIESIHNDRFRMPIFSDAPKKGIYRKFSDFKNNSPEEVAFTVDKTNKGDFLYLKNAKGEDLLQTDIWGYSDGKDCFIYSAENFFKLNKHEHTFVINGAKNFTSIRKLRMNFGLIDMAAPNSNYAKTKTANSYQLLFDLLQLDMESGELY